METLNAETIEGMLDPVCFAIEKLGFHPDPKQTEILKLNPSRCILNCTRQWGKSTITALKAVHHALYNPHSLILVMSPSARQSAEFLKKAKEFVHLLGIKPTGDGSNSISLKLPNSSRIVGLPGKESYIRGFSNVSLMLIDEAARVPNELYLSVRPMLAVSNGGLWLMSTPNGKSGFFYDTWVSDDPSWTRISIPATECPRISPANLESDRALMPAFFFRQEYLCEFHDSDAQFISSQSIHHAIQPGILPISFQPGQYPYVEPPPPALLPPGTLPDVFVDRRFYIGIDLGVIRDHTAFAVLERTRWVTGPKSPIDFCRKQETRLHVRHLERLPLGKGYGHSANVCSEILRHPDINPEYRVAVDATGVGQPFKALLHERGISSYIRWISITNGGKASPCGDNMNVPRLDLLNGLCVQFEEGRLQISDQLPLAQALAQELLSLKVRVTEAGRQAISTLSESKHDDLVFALALASYLATTERY